MSELTRDDVLDIMLECDPHVCCSCLLESQKYECYEIKESALNSLRDDYNAEVEKNKRLTAELAKVTAERDAAIEYIPKICANCAYVDEFESLPFDLPHCDSCHMMSGFKWRGKLEQEGNDNV